ncbi:Bax inhibitor-1/YccA family protein [Lacticaseibacillus baoqingensis]|uniref:Bax inhibitor-1/YccA family protein n=1 Tax=Lacticaseibacillus baoqingensis TaxID=2486013 RepID=A0ABW4E2J9_9LACO|nr:Bax inhibitor-1/YccA family protein [Lacticaseibacillus baoqingensis]
MQERRVVNDTGLATFFAKVYGTMGGGLLITAVISYLLGNVFRVQYGNFIVQNRILFIVATFLPLILSFLISGRRGRESASYARAMFGLMAASYGFTLASVWLIYPAANIGIALVVTAIVFFTMSVVGRVTRQNLSPAANIIMGVLVGVIILSVINMFMGSSFLSLIISYVILIAFIIMTAADTQALKRVYMTASGNGDFAVNTSSLAVQGALMLYLDFLNLFLVILQIFGFSNDN